MAEKNKREMIGQELVKEGIITPEQLEFALGEQRKLVEKDSKEYLGEIILRSGFVEEGKLAGFLERYLDIPHARIRREKDMDLAAVKIVPEKMARNFKVIAFGLDQTTNELCVAMRNPFDIIALDTLKSKTGRNIKRYFAWTRDIEDAIDKFYGAGDIEKTIHEFVGLKADERKDRRKEDHQELEIEAVATPVIEFTDLLLKDAASKGASDIHIEPRENELAIRYRVDGILQKISPPPKEMQSAIIVRLKLLGDMDIAEQRLPQDGRFKFRFKSSDIDVRMASSPTIYGEKLVLRLLDSTNLLINMEDLGMSAENLKEFKAILGQSYGMILVTGPTGSGKTTTLYSALNYINTPDKNIVTIEDPVEYQLKGINQIQTKHQIGLTFASGLRTVMRQDPDIIMIGEIRDLETLENAIKASLTGHLVLSTIHTNDAPSVVARLMHMGLESYLISSCLNLVIAQRLVRKICGACKEKIVLPHATLQELKKKSGVDLANVSFYRGKGCDRCDNTGYRGRTGVFEFFVVSKTIKKMILEGASEAELKEAAQKEGMKNIFQHGIEKVNKGITSLEEILRITVLEKGKQNT